MLKIKNKFVIFGHARSGSSTLKKIFESQNLNIIGEPFNKDVTTLYLNFLKNNSIEKTTDLLMEKYDGFKHLFFQLNKTENENIIKKYKTIFIYRKNLLNAAISSQLAMKTNIWGAEEVQYKENYHQIKYLDPIKIKQTLNELKDHMELYCEIAKNSFFISYEDLYEDENKIKHIENMFDFINIKIKDYSKIENLTSKNWKLNKKPWEDIIENWDEIKNLND